MKDKYEFIEYSKISKFIDELNKKDHFKDFIFEKYIQDIINAFNRYSYQNKSELFEQLFLESINNAKI